MFLRRAGAWPSHRERDDTRYMINATHIGERRLYQVARWNALPVVHGFGTRGVDLAYYLHAIERTHRIKVAYPKTHQVHGASVIRLGAQMPDYVLEADAFVTDQKGVACFVRTADCVPILLFDPLRHVVGAVHAGWRGLLAGVVQTTVARLSAWYRVNPEHLEAAIGPAIGGAMYEVDEPVVRALQQQHVPLGNALTQRRSDKWLLDVATVAANLLELSGIARARINVAGLCTYARQAEFHSYRREPGTSGRNFSFIALL